MRTLAVLFAVLVTATPVVARQEAVPIKSPRPVKMVKPTYTPEAMRARVEGVVGLSAVVQADGTVTEIKVVRSLDTQYGLDEQAIAALKQWEFEPGTTKEGKAVAVRVSVQLEFNLRASADAKK